MRTETVMVGTGGGNDEQRKATGKGVAFQTVWYNKAAKKWWSEI